ncbi:MAG: class I SAM-dependent methyltransferase [Flavobacteriales bacterium]|nr:class I SAM-dependent methyltransferase [Flavobacteriales bacterium]
MKHKLWQAIQFGKYLLRSFHLHGIHSPFVYELNETIFKEKVKFYAFEEVESIRAKLLLTTKKLTIHDLGAGSQTNNSNKRAIGDIAKSALKSPKKAQVLFRLAYHFKPTNILELGTSLGISTAYLAKACPKANIITIEGAPEVANVAAINFEKLKLNNISQVVGNFDSILESELKQLKKVDFVFFDGNHKKAPTLSYFHTCLKYAEKDSIFIFDDIYWSKEMTEAWEEIKSHPEVSVTIDCFEMGLVFFKKGQVKEHFTVYH